MSRQEVASAKCINNIETKCVQLLIPLLNLSVSYLSTALLKVFLSIKLNNWLNNVYLVTVVIVCSTPKLGIIITTVFLFPKFYFGRLCTALFSAFISGPDVLCENETVQLNSTVQNGLAPITLNWSYTINGTTFISLGGSANVSFSWNHHFEVGDLITIRLITTDALGNIITRYHHLEIIDQGCTKGKPAKSNSSGNFSDVSIYPNPTNDYLTLDAENQEFEYVVITNLNGIIVKRLFNFNASEKINISDLEKGVYNIMMKDLNGYHNRKIVKTE